MYIEQRILVGVEHIPVELLVLVLGAVLGGFQPQGSIGIDALGLLHLDGGRFLALGGIGLGGFFLDHFQINRGVHEAAVAVQYLTDAEFIGELLLLLGDVQNDIGTAGGTAALGHGESHAILGHPAHRRRALAAGQGLDGHLIGHHEGGIEAQTEMANDAALLVALIVLEEFLRAGESHLIDVFLHLVSGHTDAIIAEADLPRFLVHGDGDLVLVLAAGGEHLLLGDGIAAVGNQLADEDVLVRIQPALDDGHDILRMDGNVALLQSHGVRLL